MRAVRLERRRVIDPQLGYTEERIIVLMEIGGADHVLATIGSDVDLEKPEIEGGLPTSYVMLYTAEGAAVGQVRVPIEHVAGRPVMEVTKSNGSAS